jgi:MFS family permease
MSHTNLPTPPSKPAEPAALKPWLRPIYSLTIPDYRLLWLGQLCTSMGQWMDQVCRGWLIYELTGSPLLLGAVTACRAIPLLLFGIAAGVVADRYGKKAQLVIAQIGNAAINLLLAVLVTTHQVAVWHIFATALVAGTLQAFQQPARNALISDLVGERHILNAVALNSAVLNLSRSLGPAIAGFLIAQVGADGSYYVQALVYAVATLWTVQMHLPASADADRDRHHGSLWAGLREGFDFVGEHRELKIVLILALAPLLLGQPYGNLMPVFAKDVLKVGSQGLGLLLAAPGVGAVLGAAGVATFSHTGARGRFMLGGAAAFGLCIVGLAFAPWMAVALPLLGIAGFANTTYNALANSYIQTAAPPHLRGRVMSIYLLNRGLVPLGTLAAGTRATFFDVRTALAVMGASCTLLVVWIALAAPSIRRIE